MTFSSHQIPTASSLIIFLSTPCSRLLLHAMLLVWHAEKAARSHHEHEVVSVIGSAAITVHGPIDSLAASRRSHGWAAKSFRLQSWFVRKSMSDAARNADALQALSSLAHLKWLHVLLLMKLLLLLNQCSWTGTRAALLYVIASSSPISSQHNTYCKLTYLRDSNKPLCWFDLSVYVSVKSSRCTRWAIETWASIYDCNSDQIVTDINTFVTLNVAYKCNYSKIT